MPDIREDKLRKALGEKIGNRNPNTDFVFLNEFNAPNSWTILDKPSGQVWKIIKTKTQLRDIPFLEREAIDRIPANELVIKYIDDGTLSIPGASKPFPYLVFPFIDNATPLDKAIYNKRRRHEQFSNDEILSTAEQLVKAVYFMYQGGIVHQDIKPGNILFCSDGKIIVIDLGIARFISDDLRYIKSMQGPYAYLSPERLDMIAELSDSTKRRLSFASDLFSIGMILFEMATLDRLISKVQPGEVKKAYTRLIDLGVNEELIEIISNLLHENPLERQRFTQRQYDIDWFNSTKLDKAQYWLQHHSNGFEFIKSCLETYTSENDFGVILAGDQLRSEERIGEFVQKIKGHRIKLGIDPAVFRLAFADEYHGWLVDRPFGHIVSQNMFLKDSQITKGKQFVQSVVDFQLTNEPNILISPYFIVDRLKDRWLDTNFQSFRFTQEYLQENEVDTPLYFGLMLSERLICSTDEMEDLATQLMFNEKITHVYLRVESVRNSSTPNENYQCLMNLKSFIKTLSQSKNVFLAFADLEAFGYISDGLSAVGFNPDFEKRKSNVMERFSRPGEEIRAQRSRKRYFAHKLWNDILAETELRNPSSIQLGSESILSCDCRYCTVNGADRRLDEMANRLHFILQTDKLLATQNKETSSTTKKAAFLSLLDDAQTAYDYLQVQCQMQFDPATDGSFIPIWKRIFSE